MAKVLVSKVSAAQRQLDAAIRCLFEGEDLLAVHTVAAAAHGILCDVSKHRKRPLLDGIYEETLIDVYRKLLKRTPTKDEIRRELPNMTGKLIQHQRHPANFLKHANRDPQEVLDTDTISTDHLLLQACCIYGDLGLELTPEMRAFSRWHLAVYPSADGDELQTAVGALHTLSRDEQLDAGAFLLTLYRKPEE